MAQMHPRRILATTISACFATLCAHGANYTWDTTPGDAGAITAGSGTWDTSGSNLWNSGTTNVPWANGNTAVFGGVDGTYAITVGAAGLSTAGLIFNASGYTLNPGVGATLTTTSDVTVAAGNVANIGAGLTLARSSGSTSFFGGGTLNLFGGYSSTAGANMQITGGSTVDVKAGGSLSNNLAIVVGSFTSNVTPSNDGALIVSGGTVTTTGAANLVLGNLGIAGVTSNVSATISSGTITISTGSTHGLRFGSSSQAAGTVNGVFNLDGGTVTTPGVTRVTPTGTGVINATFNFNGGLLRANKANAAFVSNLTTATVKAGGARIDSNGFDLGIPQALLDGGGNGGLEKSGAGTLILTGANTYTGTTSILGGTLQLGTGGTVGGIGSGAIVNNGALVLNRSDAVVYPNSISGTGSVTVNGGGGVTLGGTSTYTGPTTINSGRLDLTGSLTSNLTMASGTVIAGEGSTTGSLTFAGTHTLFFNPLTVGSLAAQSVDASAATINLVPSAGSGAQTGVVVLNAPGGIVGTAGTGGNFQFSGRGVTYLNTAKTQLLFDYNPALLKWRGNDALNPSYWDVNTTSNWFNATVNTVDKFITGDAVTFDDTATSFEVNVQTPSPAPGVITFNNSKTYTIRGEGLTGNGSIVKNGTGTVMIVNNNTITGSVALNAGTVQLGDGVNATGALGTGVVTNNASLITDFGVGVGTVANSISGTGTLTQNGGGTAVLTGNNSYTGLTIVNSGALQIGDGGTTGTLGGGTVVVNSTLAFNRSDSFSVPNAISGSGGVLKLGTGTLTLGTSNTYSGQTLISGGAILITANSGMLGDTSGGTSVTQTGAALQLSGGVVVTGEALSIVGDGTNGTTTPGALRNVSGNNEWAGLVTVGVGATTRVASDAGNLKISGPVLLSPITTDQFVLQGNGNGEISGTISGASRLTKSVTGAGTWTLSGQNDFTLKTTVSNGFLRVSSLNSVNGGVPLMPTSSLGAPNTVAAGTIDFGNVNTSAGLIYTGSGETTDRVVNLVAAGTGGGSIEQAGSGVLNFTSNLAVTNAGAKTLTLLGSTAGVGEFSGVIANGPGTISVAKGGTGKWTLSGQNTYTGATNVNTGTLALAASGSISGSTSINVAGSATLDVSAVAGGLVLGAQTLTGGDATNTGFVKGAVVAGSGAAISPGLAAGSVGKLAFSEGLTVQAGARVVFDLLTAGSYDQLIVSSGNISLAGDLSSSTLSFIPSVADIFYLILNNGSGITTGTLGAPEGGSVFIGAQEFRISYTSDFGGAGFKVNGAGNDVALQAVPEPASAALALIGLGGLLCRRPRRTRSRS